ncbi:MAG: Tol-Pal system beta propeller repeat protein TolB [Gammaproteobacteria bacterium]|nr:Tol-Pal system beta propeller repeat protein TolB [Gammaproteobacteria bacterium]MDP6095278.1 Tol-Pal system beta propeller repeat protein TolB [Gammaproteobacteria bacterium]MDP7454954.1 Tol-Pal system beta propeller repeat protein TolB [Gammaproteobacteria bacterium]HJO12673.1 Tol-Pal system beta propeller repeat protein TolB [Gammaproteobacteria bacterium]
MKLRHLFPALAFWLISLPSLAELSIQITQGIDNPIPIAIVPFSMQGSGILSEDVSQIVTNDLEQVGEFRALPPSNMLGLPSQESEVFFRDWRILAQDYLLVGRIDQAPGSQLVQVQYEFFDINRELKLAGEVLTGSVAQLRDIGHEISNVVFEHVTGLRGAFTTQLLYIVSDYVSPELTYFRLEKSDYDGQRSQVLLESQEPVMSPSWSPNGQDVAYVSFETDLPRIYIQNIATGQKRQITNYPNINSSPVWSPDGTKLAMVLSKDGSPDIYVQDLVSNELVRITNHPAIETEPSWTPDGRTVVFMSDRTGQPQIYQIALGASAFDVERLTYDCFQCAKAKFLPDGVNLMHVRRETRQNPSYQIAILNIETLRVITLTDTSLDESPSLAPNGSMIMYATKYNGRGVLDAVSIDGRVKFRLPSTQGDVREPAWSPFLN